MSLALIVVKTGLHKGPGVQVVVIIRSFAPVPLSGCHYLLERILTIRSYRQKYYGPRIREVLTLRVLGLNTDGGTALLQGRRVNPQA